MGEGVSGYCVVISMHDMRCHATMTKKCRLTARLLCYVASLGVFPKHFTERIRDSIMDAAAPGLPVKRIFRFLIDAEMLAAFVVTQDLSK